MVKDYRTNVSLSIFKINLNHFCPSEKNKIFSHLKIANNEKLLNEFNTWAGELDAYLCACRDALSHSHDKLNTKVILLQNIMDVSQTQVFFAIMLLKGSTFVLKDVKKSLLLNSDGANSTSDNPIVKSFRERLLVDELDFKRVQGSNSSSNSNSAKTSPINSKSTINTSDSHNIIKTYHQEEEEDEEINNLEESEEFEDDDQSESNENKLINSAAHTTSSNQDPMKTEQQQKKLTGKKAAAQRKKEKRKQRKLQKLEELEKKKQIESEKVQQQQKLIQEKEKEKLAQQNNIKQENIENSNANKKKKQKKKNKNKTNSINSNSIKSAAQQNNSDSEKMTNLTNESNSNNNYNQKKTLADLDDFEDEECEHFSESDRPHFDIDSNRLVYLRIFNLAFIKTCVEYSFRMNRWVNLTLQQMGVKISEGFFRFVISLKPSF
jgi:hypothetical protein